MNTPTETSLVSSYSNTLTSLAGVTSLSDTSRAIGIGYASAYTAIAVLTWIQTQLPADILQGLYTLFGLTPLPATAASVSLVFTGTSGTVIPQGTQVSTVGNATTPAILFQTTASATISSTGSVSVNAVSLSTGSATNVAPNSITILATGVPGVSSVTNPEAAAGGTDVESATHQLSRFQQFLQNLAASTVPNLSYQLAQITGVQTLAVVTPAYFSAFAYEATGSVWVDDSIEANFPKGVPFVPFPATSLTTSDALYIGANRAFHAIYLDVATPGSGVSTVWEYWSTTNQTWTTLTTTDNTSGGQTSGTMNWTVPTDWGMTTVNGQTLYWIRLRLTSTTYTTLPTWYQVLSLDPPAPYCYVYVQPLPGQIPATVLQAVSQAAPQYTATGTTVVVKEPNLYTQNITYSIIPTAAGNEQQDLITQVNQSLSDLFTAQAIGQFLPVSAIYNAIQSTGNGQYIQQVQVSEPSADVYVGADTLIVEGTVTGTLN
jgi:uncharacterized phage protein gp47/JayE